MTLQQEITSRARERWRAGRIVNPIPGYPITYAYGVEDDRYEAGYHTGEDHSTNHVEGKLCVAVAPGRVVEAAYDGGTWGEAYGLLVVVQTSDDRFRYGYAHLSHPLVMVGDELQPGDPIGLSGNSGNSSGPHLHFEARRPPFHYGDDCHPIKVKRKPADV